MNRKVVVIGCGNVGMAYAFALLNQRTSVNELVLIDVDMERVKGEVSDLNHCIAFSPSHKTIKAGTYEDCKDAAIVMIAAGANQGPGETRMDLISKNSKIFKEIVGKVMTSGFDGIFLIATNPVDVMTQITWKYSGLPKGKVIGSGTTLDTARLRYIVGEKLNVGPKHVHAYVIGEHGDSELVPWSCATVGLQNMKSFLTHEEMEEIYVDVRDAAYDIIGKKGATYYGIGMCLVGITNAILGNENSVMTVSAYDEENGVYAGFPCIVNKDGVQRKIHIDLTPEEEAKLQHSLNVIKEAVDKIED